MDQKKLDLIIATPFKHKTVMYRMIEGFGWYVVGYSKAKSLGLTHYATPNSLCAKGHVAPMLVARTKCIKCLSIEARNKGGKMSKERAREYWRRKLKLPRQAETQNARFVYVVENMPYAKISEASHMSGLPESLIYYRCQQEAFTDYHKLPTKFKLGQQFVYWCAGREYITIKDAGAGEKITHQELIKRFADPEFPTWFKQRVM